LFQFPTNFDFTSITMLSRRSATTAKFRHASAHFDGPRTVATLQLLTAATDFTRPAAKASTYSPTLSLPPCSFPAMFIHDIMPETLTLVSYMIGISMDDCHYAVTILFGWDVTL
jgi:hypothetical protein